MGRAYKVIIMGASVSTGNLGVSALAESTVYMLKKAQPTVDIVFCLSKADSTPERINFDGEFNEYKVINYRLSPKSELGVHIFWITFLVLCYRMFRYVSPVRRLILKNKFIQNVLQTDFVADIRGGDSFSDIYGLASFLKLSIARILIILLNKPLVLLPQTYGPYKSDLSKIIARKIFKNSEIILARDEDSLNTAKEYLGEDGRYKMLEMSPDVAFHLQKRTAGEYKIVPKRDGHQKFSIGLNVSGMLFNEPERAKSEFGLKFLYDQWIMSVVEELINLTSGDIILVPHCYSQPKGRQNDYEACRYVFERFADKGSIYLLEGRYDPGELKYLIGQCDFFSGARMHACIAGISQCVPTVGMAYSGKFLGVFKTVGVDSVLDLRKLGEDEALQYMITCYEKKDAIKRKLCNMINKTRSDAEKSFEKIFDVI